MKKTLISEIHITNPTIKISYYLLQNNDRFGAGIEKTSGKTAQYMIPGTYAQVESFILWLAENAAMPEHLCDCAHDYIVDNFSLETVS